jgi:hypothetical protein
MSRINYVAFFAVLFLGALTTSSQAVDFGANFNVIPPAGNQPVLVSGAATASAKVGPVNVTGAVGTAMNPATGQVAPPTISISVSAGK